MRHIGAPVLLCGPNMLTASEVGCLRGTPRPQTMMGLPGPARNPELPKRAAQGGRTVSSSCPPDPPRLCPAFCFHPAYSPFPHWSF